MDLLQHEFLFEVLKALKAEGVHTAIETSGFCLWEVFERTLPYLDLIIMDIKLADDKLHEHVTGVSNSLILENTKKLAGTGKQLIIRTPVIPGVNDNAEAIGDIAAIIKSFKNLLYYELMPFHQMAKSKFSSIGLKYNALELQQPGMEQLKALVTAAEHQGIKNVLVDI